MKTRVGWFVIAALVLTPLRGQDPVARLTQADREFDAGRYRDAAGQYAAAWEVIRSTAVEPDVVKRSLLRLVEVYALLETPPGPILENIAKFQNLAVTNEERVRLLLAQGRVKEASGDGQGALNDYLAAEKLALDKLGANHPWAAAAILERAEVDLDLERYDQAARAFADAQKMLGARKPDTQFARAWLGPVEVLIEQGKYADARKQWDQLKAAWPLPEAHPSSAELRALRAKIELAAGDVPRAEQLAANYAQTMERSYGPDHRFTAEAHLIEAEIRMASQQLEEAAKGLESAGRVYSRTRNAADPSDGLYALGKAALAQRDFDKAAQQLSKAVEARRVRYGDDGVKTVDALVALGQAEVGLGRPEQAEARFQTAVSRLSNRVDKNHITLLAAQHGLASVWHGRGDFAKSEPLYKEFLTARASSVAGEEATAVALEALADAAEARRQNEDAEKLLERAQAVREQQRRGAGPLVQLRLGEVRARRNPRAAVPVLQAALKQPNIPPQPALRAWTTLGDCHLRLGRPADAVEPFANAVKLSERLMKEDDPRFAAVTDRLIQALTESKQPSAALPYLDRRLKIEERKGDRLSEPALAIVGRISYAHLDQGNFREATPHLERLWEAAQQGRGSAVMDRAQLFERLGQTYERTGKELKAAGLYAERARLALLRANYAEASQFGERVRTLLGAKAPDAPEMATALAVLGEVRVAQNQPDQAELLYKQSLEKSGANESVKALSLHGLARLAYSKRDFAQCQQRLTEAQESLGPDSNQNRALRALIVGSLAALRALEDKREEAMRLYDQFAQLEEVATSPNDLPLVAPLREQASFYYRAGRADAAGRVTERQLVAASAVFGPASVDAAYAHQNLGIYSASNRNYERAFREFREALRIFEAIQARSEAAASALSLLGESQKSSGDLAGALDSYEDALEVLEQLPKKPNELTASVLNQMAGVCRQLKKYDRALSAYQKVSELYAADPKNPNWVNARKNVLAGMIDLGMVNEANLELTNLRGTIRTAYARKDSMAEAEVLREVAAAMRRTNRAREADRLEADAKRIAQRAGGK
jgi:tetratricopeptide (TPR) repeat protein